MEVVALSTWVAVEAIGENLGTRRHGVKTWGLKGIYLPYWMRGAQDLTLRRSASLHGHDEMANINEDHPSNTTAFSYQRHRGDKFPPVIPSHLAQVYIV